MSNWKSDLHEILAGLSRTHATAPLAEVRRILRGVLGVEDVAFFGRDGRELTEQAALQETLRESCHVTVRLQYLQPGAGVADFALPAEYAAPSESRFREGMAAHDTADITADPRYEYFLREFLRLEQRHDFMWAGYIVRELLPRLGFAPEEAKLVLDRLRAENIVTITKVPNPKNPDFPATGVQLNHDHPHVKALFGPAVEPSPEVTPNGSALADPADREASLDD